MIDKNVILNIGKNAKLASREACEAFIKKKIQYSNQWLKHLEKTEN